MFACKHSTHSDVQEKDQELLTVDIYVGGAYRVRLKVNKSNIFHVIFSPEAEEKLEARKAILFRKFTEGALHSLSLAYYHLIPTRAREGETS